MTRDASLSEFGGGDGSGGEPAESDRNEDGDGSADPGVDGEDETADAGTESAVSTYAWGGTYACSACESAVERVWRDGGALVCEECKTW